MLKSTEPYIEQYFALDRPKAQTAAELEEFLIAGCAPRHWVIACRRPKTPCS